MKILAVVCHPLKESMTWSVLRKICEGIASISPGIEVDVVDLYDDGFLPQFTQSDFGATKFLNELDDDVLSYQTKLDQADALVFVTPIYWWSVPAMLKGWFDRVFTHGWAYDLNEEGKVRGKLKDRPVLFVSLGATDQEGYERHQYDKAFHTQVDYGILSYCGLRSVQSHTFFSVIERGLGGADPQIILADAESLGQQLAERLQ